MVLTIGSAGLSVLLSFLSVFNNLSIVCLQLFVGFHSGAIALVTMAIMSKIWSNDHIQDPGILMEKLGHLVPYISKLGGANITEQYDQLPNSSNEKSSDNEDSLKNGHLSDETS